MASASATRHGNLTPTNIDTPKRLHEQQNNERQLHDEHQQQQLQQRLQQDERQQAQRQQQPATQQHNPSASAMEAIKTMGAEDRLTVTAKQVQVQLGEGVATSSANGRPAQVRNNYGKVVTTFQTKTSCLLRFSELLRLYYIELRKILNTYVSASDQPMKIKDQLDSSIATLQAHTRNTAGTQTTNTKKKLLIECECILSVIDHSWITFNDKESNNIPRAMCFISGIRNEISATFAEHERAELIATHNLDATFEDGDFDELADSDEDNFIDEPTDDDAW